MNKGVQHLKYMPKRILDLFCIDFDNTEKVLCVACKKQLELSISETFVYRCHQFPDNIIFVELNFCPNSYCITIFGQKMQDQQLDRFFDTYPNTYMGLKNNRKGLADKYIKNHVRTGEFCMSCRLMEETNSSFKICSGCNYVRYCSKQCQKDHWKQHKHDCISKRKGGPSNHQIYSRERINCLPNCIDCDCFNDYQKHIFKSMNTDKCSQIKCHNDVLRSLDIYKYSSKCLNEDYTHTFYPLFCSAKCRKKFRSDIKNI